MRNRVYDLIKIAAEREDAKEGLWEYGERPPEMEIQGNRLVSWGATDNGATANPSASSSSTGTTDSPCTPSGPSTTSTTSPIKPASPRCTLHDLRHLAVTAAISEGASLWAASQTARHPTISTTANIYAHPTRRTAHQAVDAIAAALNREEHHRDHNTTTTPAHQDPVQNTRRLDAA
ncbi:hypothetical protein AB0M68_36900 [Streptomyces sp. NPDC051453]|uniref:hypothetical protein n=1 Tax=Streptomyces sp. NPDC051453 TaxID=3154941 RepID=UPI00343AA557